MLQLFFILLFLNNPEDFLQHGLALASSGQYREAEQTLMHGFHLAPQNKRFPQEMAGIAFKQKDLDRAKRWLIKAYDLDSNDQYTLHFLGTIHFLQDNLEAALKYWNRLNMPQIASFQMKPEPLIEPILLDRSLAFAPSSLLKMEEYRKTMLLVKRLDVFSSIRIRLSPSSEGKFDLGLYATERSNLNGNKLFWLLNAFRDLPCETIYLNFNNLEQKAVNFSSLLRWDSEKRRALFALSSPIKSDPAKLFELEAEWRDEQWNISSNLSDPESMAEFGMEKWRLAPSFSRVITNQLEWKTEVELASRKFSESTYPEGFSFVVQTGINGALLRIPERKLFVDFSLAGSIGRIFSDTRPLFSQLNSTIRMDWSVSSNDDWKLTNFLSSGTSLGDIPFDDLYSIGIDRDSELWIRGYKVDDKKGNNPLARHYALWSTQLEKKAYSNGLMDFFVGPFFDGARTWQPSKEFFPSRWMFDAGILTSVRIFKAANVTASYGWDLQTGKNVFYIYLKS